MGYSGEVPHSSEQWINHDHAAFRVERGKCGLFSTLGTISSLGTQGRNLVMSGPVVQGVSPVPVLSHYPSVLVTEAADASRPQGERENENK